MIEKSFWAVCCVTLLGCWSPALVYAAEIDEAIQLYDRSQYKSALLLLDELNANRPTEKSHYYAGLCCQNLSQVQRAEDEYRWVYLRGKDAQLRYYAWSALKALAEYRVKRTFAGHGNTSARGAGVRIQRSTTSSSCATMPNDPVELDDTPGVANNSTPPGFYGGGGWQVTFGPSACGRH